MFLASGITGGVSRGDNWLGVFTLNRQEHQVWFNRHNHHSLPVLPLCYTCLSLQPPVICPASPITLCISVRQFIQGYSSQLTLSRGTSPLVRKQVFTPEFAGFSRHSTLEKQMCFTVQGSFIQNLLEMWTLFSADITDGPISTFVYVWTEFMQQEFKTIHSDFTDVIMGLLLLKLTVFTLFNVGFDQSWLGQESCIFYEK